MNRWTEVKKQLPPDGVPVLARWADGSQAPATLVDGADAWEWWTTHEGDALPEAWRFDTPQRHISAKLLGSMSPALPIIAFGAAVLTLAGFLPYALALVALILGLWGALTLLSVATDYLMARRGGWAALLAFLTLGLALSAAALFLAWRMIT